MDLLHIGHLYKYKKQGLFVMCRVLHTTIMYLHRRLRSVCDFSPELVAIVRWDIAGRVLT